MYYFILGRYEKNAIHENILENEKYLGRAKTKDKYVYILTALHTILSKTLEYQNIKGDLFYIDNNKNINHIEEKLSVNEGVNKKEKIIVIDKDGNEIEAYTYFSTHTEEKIKKLGSDIIDEYTDDMKLEHKERMLLLNGYSKGNIKSLINE